MWVSNFYLFFWNIKDYTDQCIFIQTKQMLIFSFGKFTERPLETLELDRKRTNWFFSMSFSSLVFPIFLKIVRVLFSSGCVMENYTKFNDEINI